VKIISALFISFLVSAFIFNYSHIGEKPTLATEKVVNDLSLIKDKIYSFLTIPGNMFSTDIVMTKAPTIVPNLTNNREENISPTSEEPSMEPTEEIKQTITAYNTPRAIYTGISPTQKLKPTKKPKATPTPTIKVGEQRPGVSIDEIANIANEITCVPIPLLKSIVMEEAGDIFKLSQSQIIFYNSFNWWNKATSLTQVCSGYGYYAKTGIVANDSNFAGLSCSKPLGGIVDVREMGPTQMSSYVWDAYKERVKDLLGQTTSSLVDRRVMLDASIALGLHLKNISTYRGSSCNDWELKYIAKAACKYHRKCGYTHRVGSGNYCYDVCQYYNNFSGKKFDCNKIEQIIPVDDGKCEIN
jgi:hypothetical protein